MELELKELLVGEEPRVCLEKLAVPYKRSNDLWAVLTLLIFGTVCSVIAVLWC